MRIALFTDFFPPQVNGIVDSTISLAIALCNRGHEVRMFTIKTTKKSEDFDFPFSVSQYSAFNLPFAWDWTVAFPFGLLADCKAFKPDIIHTHSNGSIGYLAPKIAKKLQVPLVGTSHTFPAEFMLNKIKMDFGWARHMIRKMNSKYYNRCTITIAPSDALLKELKQYGMRTPDRRVSNIVQTDIFNVSTKRDALRLKLNVRGFTLLSCGSLTIEKSLDCLLDGFLQVLQSGLQAELVVIGDGAERKKLMNTVKKMGIENAVRFTGFLPRQKVAEWMNAVDAYVITAKHETQSLTLMQSMACGLPVIAVNAGGIPDYVRDGINGLLIPPDDPIALATAVSRLQDTSLRSKLIAAALKTIQAECSPEAVVVQMEKIYEEACNLSTKQ